MVGAVGPSSRIQAARPDTRKLLIRWMLKRSTRTAAHTAAQQVCVAARNFVSRRVLSSYGGRIGTRVDGDRQHVGTGSRLTGPSAQATKEEQENRCGPRRPGTYSEPPTTTILSPAGEVGAVVPPPAFWMTANTCVPMLIAPVLEPADVFGCTV